MPSGAFAPPPHSDAGYESQGRGSMTPSAALMRPMRLKILYTFDEQSKVNCLARWPHIINVQTVDLDEATCIGVVELKICIQAVVSSSPELVAKLGQDYTVYAFDYSEQDTPLVGQGMLSWALASPSSGATTPQSRAIITGRVSRSVLGIFSSGVSETLEVKLRLVPVPACQQSEFINSLDRYRELSKVMPPDFDASAWTSFLQENPNAAELADQLKTSSHTRQNSQAHGAAGLEALSQLMHANSPAPQEVSMSTELTWSGHNVGSYDVGSRTGSPYQITPTPVEYPGYMHTGPGPGPSRPASQGSTRSMSLQQSNAEFSQEFQSASGDPLNPTHADGPMKKRARTTKTDWSGRPTMGVTAESLRVTASTAASIRTFRPIAMRPSTSEGMNLEEPPRQPTPVPEAGGGRPRRVRPVTRSGLRQESFHVRTTSSEPASPSNTNFTHESYHQGMPMEDSRQESMMGSPGEMASSPPTFDQHSPAPSSPGLPMLPLPVDSGFMSGPVEDPFVDARPVGNEVDRAVTGPTKPAPAAAPAGMPPLRFDYESPGPYELLPTHILPRPVRSRRKNKSASAVPSEMSEQPSTDAPQVVAPKPRRAIKTNLQPVVSTPEVESEAVISNNSNNYHIPPPPSRRNSRTPSMASATSPPVAANEPVVTVTDTSFAQPTVEKTTQPRSGSGAKRKKAIQRRLQTAIGNGEMPPFCQNCGAIETPTWRKAWSKKLEGPSVNVHLSTEEGGIIAMKDIVRDEGGNVTSVIILKKTLLPGEEGFIEVQLCNPCGLWLQKFKCMRPEERWNKEAKDPSGKKKPSKKRKQQSEPATGAVSNTSASGAVSQRDEDTNTPPQEAPEDGHAVVEQGSNEVAVVVHQTTSNAVRAASLQPRPSNAGGDEGVIQPQRQTQSSPGPGRGQGQGTECSPIDLDDWGSTRRLLFPSPNKNQDEAEGEGSRTLKDITPSEKELLQEKEKNDNLVMKPILTLCDSTTSNKENVTPAVSEHPHQQQQQQEDFDLSHLFEGIDGGDDDNEEASPPKTPKTPRTPPHRRSPKSDRVLRSSTRSALQERTNGAMTSSSSSSKSSAMSGGRSSSSGRRRHQSNNKLLRTPNSTTRRLHQILSTRKSRSPRSATKAGSGGSPRQQQQQQKMSPFTAQMYSYHYLLSEPNNNNINNVSSPRVRLFTDNENTNNNPDGNKEDDNNGLISNFEDFLPLLPGCGSGSSPGKFSQFDFGGIGGMGMGMNVDDFFSGGGGRVSIWGDKEMVNGIEAGDDDYDGERNMVVNDVDEEELSTDIILPLQHLPPPPSSPPIFFQLYHDPQEPKGGIWSDFDIPVDDNGNGDGDGGKETVEGDDVGMGELDGEGVGNADGERCGVGVE
ncbi:MAG: hypothetical protein M1823_005616 [Watsoniomyces obsoletus]|nr:MAG: hypothetical protein M1823_005616 [Watsoniomyces obsoletus]